MLYIKASGQGESMSVNVGMSRFGLGLCFSSIRTSENNRVVHIFVFEKSSSTMYTKV